MKTRIFSSLLLLSASVLTLTSCSTEDGAYDLGVSYPAPTLTGISQTDGIPTGIVTVTGTNFGTERNYHNRVGRIYFNGTPVTEYISWSDTEATVRIPEGATTGPVSITVWKNTSTLASNFTCLPQAVITNIAPTDIFLNQTITLTGTHFDYFISKGLTANDVKVCFTSKEGLVEAKVTEFTAEHLMVVVPEDAIGGPLNISFGQYQQLTTADVKINGVVDDIVIDLGAYSTIEGTISASSESGIGSTKRGCYVIYPVCVPVDGNYELHMNACTYGRSYKCYLNGDIGTDEKILADKTWDDNRTLELLNGSSWSDYSLYNFGIFTLKAGTTYYIRLGFNADGTSWVGNVGDIRLVFSEDQSSESNSSTIAYNLYQNDFNSDSKLPFVDSWAWDPSYIKVVDNSLEFYFNQAALDADNRRERRGCEVTCNFKTASEGWYGFQFFLPDGKFPKDIDGSIIAQIFNCGDRNSWAGHIHIDKDQLKIAHRFALVDPTVGTIGTVKWNTWIPVVVYFRAGRNGKGCIRAWMGEDMQEPNPSYEADGIDFAFGEWVNDTTLDDTVSETNEKADYLGCKFGLYVSTGGDRTIRFDNMRVLEDNPIGAFNIVRPF